MSARTASLLSLAATLLLAVGCDSKVQDKQPKLQGQPDPRIQGPANPGASGGQGAGQAGNATIPAGK